MSSTRSDKAKITWSYLGIGDIPRDIYGVYAFWCRDNGKCIYVGKAEDQPVKARLRRHWNGSHNETLRLWIEAFGSKLDVCYMAADAHRIDRLEKLLIKAWKPEANIEHNEK